MRASRRIKDDRGSEGSLDGRVRRGRENRDKILQAVYELVRENQVPPTADQVAARAKVGERTVFRHFADMKALRADMSARVRGEIGPVLLKQISPEGSFDSRVKALVHKRARIFEHIAPFRRVSASRPGQFEQERARLTAFLRSELEHVFAREVERMSRETLDAIDAITSFEMWDRLRRDQKLGRSRAEAVIIQAIRRLVGY